MTTATLLDGASLRRSAVAWKNVLPVMFLWYCSLLLGVFVIGGRIEGDVPPFWFHQRIKDDTTRRLQSIGNNSNQTKEIELVDILTLKNHSNVITCIALTPDKKRILSGSRDDTVKIWSLSTGELERTLVNHTNHVKSVVVTPDNTRIVSSSWDKTIKVWSLSTGELNLTLEEDRQHKFGVLSVAVSPDSARIVSGLADGSINIWSLTMGELEIRLPTAHSNHIHGVAIAPAGDKFVSAGQDSTIKVWSFGSSQPDLTLRNHSASVRSVVVTPDNLRIVSGSLDGTIKIWSLATGELERTIAFNSSNVVESVAVPADGNTIVAALRREDSGEKKVDGSIQVLSLHTGELKHRLDNPASIGVVAVTSDGSTVLSESFENSITVWQAVYREPTSLSTKERDPSRPPPIPSQETIILATAVTIGMMIIIVVTIYLWRRMHNRRGGWAAVDNQNAAEESADKEDEGEFEEEPSPEAGPTTEAASSEGRVPKFIRCEDSIAVSSCTNSRAFTANSGEKSKSSGKSSGGGTASSGRKSRTSGKSSLNSNNGRSDISRPLTNKLEGEG